MTLLMRAGITITEMPCDRCGTLTRLARYLDELLCKPCRDGILAADREPAGGES